MSDLVWLSLLDYDNSMLIDGPSCLYWLNFKGFRIMRMVLSFKGKKQTKVHLFLVKLHCLFSLLESLILFFILTYWDHMDWFPEIMSKNITLHYIIPDDLAWAFKKYFITRHRYCYYASFLIIFYPNSKCATSVNRTSWHLVFQSWGASLHRAKRCAACQGNAAKVNIAVQLWISWPRPGTIWDLCVPSFIIIYLPSFLLSSQSPVYWSPLTE